MADRPPRQPQGDGRRQHRVLVATHGDPTPRHMFSVCLLRGEMDRWVVVCDACGVELDVAGGGMPVFRVRGLDELSAKAVEEYARRLQAMASARSVTRAIVVDSNVELERLGHDLEARLVEHSETCGKLEKK